MLDNEGLVETYLAPDRSQLYYRCWPPTSVSAPSFEGNIACIYTHGGTTHSLWFSDIARSMSQAGVTIYGLDRRGSGLNQSHRFDTSQFKRDTVQFIKNILANHSEVHLIGLCHGGVTFLHCVVAEALPVASITLINPLLGVNRQYKNLYNTVRVIFKALLGNKIPASVQAARFTHNRDFHEYCNTDPMRLRELDARFWTDLFFMSRYIFKSGSGLKNKPIFVQLGEVNSLISFDEVFRLFSKHSLVGTIRVYAAGTHILFFDRPDQVTRDLLWWVRTGWKQASGVEGR